MKKVLIVTIIIAIELLLVVSSVGTANSKETSYFLIGAYGDDGSKDNIGVRVEIRTHTYNSSYLSVNGVNRTSDGFALVEPFSDGSVIYFGFAPFLGKANWYWGRNDANGQLEEGRGGPIGSGGVNGTWHSYSIELIPSETGRKWGFIFDGIIVGTTRQTQTEDKATTDVALFEAVKDMPMIDSSLGPAEFRNLMYLTSDGWHGVQSLRVKSYCSEESQCADSPFGISELGPNHVILGSGIPKRQNGEILWALNPIDYVSPYLTFIILAVVIALAYFSVRRKLIIFPSSNPSAS